MVIVNCMDITECKNELYEKARHISSEERRKKPERYRFIDDSKRAFVLVYCFNMYFIRKMANNKFVKIFIKNREEFKYNITH